MKKVISIIFIYALLFMLSVNDLSAQENEHDFGNGYGRDYRQNGYGYGHGYDTGFGSGLGPGNGPLDGYGYGHGYDIVDGPGNGYGFGHTEVPPGTNAPEPISSALFILGGAGLGLYKRFKNKN